MLFDEDICRCASESCPMYKTCYRGAGHDYKPGIYTFADLLHGEDCGANLYMYIKGDNKNVNKE